MTEDEKFELEIFKAWRLLSDGPSRYVRLARIIDFTDIEPSAWRRVLMVINGKRTARVIPESNQKVLAADDHAASVSIGNEARHLIAFDADYRPPTY